MNAEDRAFLERLEALCEAARRHIPDEPVPCFGHMALRVGGRGRDVLLGWQTVDDPAVTVLHWQTAPLAAVYFTQRDGDEYELDLRGRTIEGTLVRRSLLRFDRGALCEVRTRDAVFSRAFGGAWARSDVSSEPLLRPRPADAPRPAQPFTLDALDPAQRAAVQLDATTALLLVGEAGCGKTTVALHRVAELRRRALAAGEAFSALVLVPVEGLRRLSEIILAKLGAPDVKVRVFDRWAAVQARKVFGGLPRRESRDVLPSVVRLKRHPALAEALRAVAARKGAPRGATAVREDLQHLFGDRELLAKVVAASGGALTALDMERVLEHTRVQFTETTEEAFAHVDKDRLAALDGLTLDRGTPTEDAGAMDAEDHALLFAIAALRAERRSEAPRPTRYDCVVLDETQEFSPYELALVGKAVRGGGSLIVAGDEGQQVDPTAYFSGWAASMRLLGAAQHTRVELAVSYRCPDAVTAVARAVLHPQQGPGERAAGEHLAWSAQPQLFHLVAALSDALQALGVSDRQASVAVVCRTAERAQQMASLLGRFCDARLAERGDFRFAPGVEVAAVQEVKGLEFDYVVVPDASPSAYPDDPASRRAMYVAITRASQQVLLMTPSGWSPVLPGALPRHEASG